MIKIFGVWFILAAFWYTYVCLRYQYYPPKWVRFTAGVAFASLFLSLIGVVLSL